jgi:hypothetical protein
MSLSATAVIQAAPNDIPRMKSAAEATAQEDLVSMEADGIATSGGDHGLVVPFTVYTKFRHPMPSTGLLCVLHLCQNACTAADENALLPTFMGELWNGIDEIRRPPVAIFSSPSLLAIARYRLLA